MHASGHLGYEIRYCLLIMPKFAKYANEKICHPERSEGSIGKHAYRRIDSSLHSE